MAILNFPDTTGQPTDGSFTYTENGVIYVWDGNKWTAGVANNLTDTFVNRDGDTMTGDLTVPSLNGGPLAGLRNQLINGDFRVWQRGEDLTYASGLNFGPDRWKFSGAVTVNQDGVTKPLGAVSSMRLSANALPQYGVELTENNQGSTSAPFSIGSQWTLSVWCNEDITGASSMFRFRDEVGSPTNSVEATAGVPNWTQLTTTASNGFHRYGITVTITASPAGTNRALNISLPASTGADRRYALAQLEPGPVATPFEQRPIGLELQLCQRYYQTAVVNGITFLNSVTNVGLEGYINIPLHTPMRFSQPSLNRSHFCYSSQFQGANLHLPIRSSAYAQRGTLLLAFQPTGDEGNAIRTITGVSNGADDTRNDVIGIDDEL